MEDLIKRDDAIKVVRESKAWHFNEIVPVLSAIKGIPSAEKQGEWMFVGNSIESMWECSECGEKEFGSKSELTKYCPECGCRMKGADNE